MFLEAKVLHLADMMDAEIWKFKRAVPSYEGGKWSDFMRTIGNEVFLGNRTAISEEE
jgi:23S rRNA maturation-related 3'-5' exoribonuclease YhaM